jgi:hypothetical protein
MGMGREEWGREVWDGEESRREAGGGRRKEEGHNLLSQRKSHPGRLPARPHHLSVFLFLPKIITTKMDGKRDGKRKGRGRKAGAMEGGGRGGSRTNFLRCSAFYQSHPGRLPACPHHLPVFHVPPKNNHHHHHEAGQTQNGVCGSEDVRKPTFFIPGMWKVKKTKKKVPGSFCGWGEQKKKKQTRATCVYFFRVLLNQRLFSVLRGKFFNFLKFLVSLSEIFKIVNVLFGCILASSFFEILDQLTVIAKEPFTLFEILGRWEGRQRRREGEWLRMRDEDKRDEGRGGGIGMRDQGERDGKGET